MKITGINTETGKEITIIKIECYENNGNIARITDINGNTYLPAWIKEIKFNKTT